MIYTEDFFIKRKKETESLLHFLQECKYSGSWDTKVDLNVIIKTIANYEFYVTELRKENTELENKIKELTKTGE
jgi:hypothetical protein